MLHRRLSPLLVGLIALPLASAALADAQPTPDPAPLAASATASAGLGESLPAPEGEPSPATFQRAPATHAWLRFSPGAWRRTVITTQTFAPGGELASTGVTTQDEELATAESQGYVLRTRATVTALGRVIEGQWVDVSYSQLLDGPGVLVAQQRMDDEAVVVDGQSYDCQVWQLKYDASDRRMTDLVWYSAEKYPHVLMRQRLTLADDPTASPDRIETVEVVAGALPYRFGDDLLMCACLRTTREGPKGRTVEVALISQSTPGGQVVAWSTDWNAENRRVQTTVAETVEFGTEPPVLPRLPRRQIRQQRRAARGSAAD